MFQRIQIFTFNIVEIEDSKVELEMYWRYPEDLTMKMKMFAEMEV